MTKKLLAFAFVLSFVTLTGGASLAAEKFAPAPDIAELLTTENLEKLEKGGVILEKEIVKDASGNDRGRGVALILIDAGVDDIIKTIDDFETYPKWMPSVKKTEVKLREGDRRDVAFELSVMWNTVRYTCIHRVDPARGLFEWRMDDSQEKKNVQDSTGAWVLRSLGDKKTAVAYTVLLDTGISVPAFVQDFLTNRSLPDVVVALRNRVEGKN